MKLCPFQPRVFTALTLACVIQSQAAGLTNRVPNITLTNLPPAPPVFGYTVANAIPTVSLSGPVCITSPPGETNRLFILERGGNIVVVTNLANPNRTVFMSLPVVTDSESGLLGLAFHPGYATNRYFYVFYSRNLNTSQGNGLHQRVSRFQTSASNPNQALTNTELSLITQLDPAPNHNGGDLHFGPDEYLYISVGDGGIQFDGSRNSQTITTKFFSAIMRIDVNKRPGNLLPNPHPANTTNYFIPADNPYIGLTNFNGQTINPTNIRTEFYAIGFRNPWRMSFDRTTGLLYLGDVGQDTWEEVSVIVKGGNYGWVWREGAHPGYRTGEAPPGFTSIDPIQDYPHSGDANYRGVSVIGGVVYRGSRISQLYGAYIFSDNGSGNVWMLRYDGTNTVPFQRITGASGPSAFGTDPRNGDILIAQLNNNQIGRLDYSATSSGPPLPPTLADTGAFSNLTSLTPNPGIVPYDLNVPFWSDNSIKSRWFSVPNTNLTISFNPDGNWSFPTGAVWIKHFELELTNGVPSSRKQLETRFIVKNAGGVYGITYRWGNSTTNAALVPEEGMDEPFVIDEGGGILRTQVWHYPSRLECLRCHTGAGGFALGFNTAQLNRDHDYGSAVTNQIAALSLAGYFNTDVGDVHTLRSLAPATNAAVSLEYRVRSYLAANCVQCHQPGGSAQALWDARITTTTENAGIINGPLLQNNGDANNRVIAPGSLTNSTLLTRISVRGPGQMPPLASTVLDTNAITLVGAWITNDLPNYQTFADWQIAVFGSTNSPDAGAEADPDGDGANNRLEYLTGTSATNSLEAWNISVSLSDETVQIAFPQIANRAFQVQGTTNLFSPNSWSPLDAPANEPFFSISNRTAVVPDDVSAALEKFYRVRVIEP